MPLPSKALRYGQLKMKTAGFAVPTSGHEVLKVEFKDTDGEIKTGFYKPLDPTYPALLAKYAVAVSVALRLSLGEHAAEDRLVFNEEGEIVGTVSIALKGYRPLLCTGQSEPSDLQEKELVNPSVATLLKYNIAEIIVAGLLFYCDDRHPGNTGAILMDKDKKGYGWIDNDMTLYPYTAPMKGGRWVDGTFLKESPEKTITLKSKTLDNFPNVEDRTHWWANSLPKNGNILKRCMAYEAFQALAANPSLETEEGSISFQEQFFSALLKNLLVYDPQMLQKRLVEYISEESTLDYLALPLEKSQKLSEMHPELFNPKTNDQPFIDHWMTVFQKVYDEHYRAIVFYMGCESNKSGVPVVGFRNFLDSKPSAYQKIRHWMSNENKKMEDSWQRYQLKRSQPSSEASKSEPEGVVDGYAVATEARYNLTKMEQRYHQIWRDAHVFTIKNILFETNVLIARLGNPLRLQQLPLSITESVLPEDPSLVAAWQLLGDVHPLAISDQVDCDKENSLRKGLLVLERFAADLNNYAQEYYKLTKDGISLEHNQNFCDAMARLILSSESEIYQSFGASTWAKEFAKIVEDLQQFYGGLHFQRHLLLSKDAPLGTGVKYDYPALLKRKHTDDEVVTACLQALFDWAKKLDRDTLDDTILTIIKKSYEPSPYNLVANRKRASEVKEYLKTTTEDGANRLAAILSKGGHESTSLNTLLVAKLIPMMLQATIGQVDVNLLSVRNACDREIFADTFYTEKAIKFALNDKQFTHIYAKKNLDQFNDIMYKWVEDLGRKKFKTLVFEALAEYEPYGFNFLSRKTRGPTVRNYFTAKPALTNQKILAFIFADGGKEDNSLNTILFNKILSAMKADVSVNKEKLAIPGFGLVPQIGEQAIAYYIASLQEHAKPRTFDEEEVHHSELVI